MCLISNRSFFGSIFFWRAFIFRIWICSISFFICYKIHFLRTLNFICIKLIEISLKNLDEQCIFSEFILVFDFLLRKIRGKKRTMPRKVYSSKCLRNVVIPMNIFTVRFFCRWLWKNTMKWNDARILCFFSISFSFFFALFSLFFSFSNFLPLSHPSCAVVFATWQWTVSMSMCVRVYVCAFRCLVP